MIEKVRISVRGEQICGDDRTVTQQETVGTMEQTEEGLRICYDEGMEGGLENTQTELLLGDACATLTRSGGVRCQMTFEVGKTHPADYQTPQGGIAMEVTTSKYRSRFSERGGLVELAYVLTMNGKSFGENKLKLRVQR